MFKNFFTKNKQTTKISLVGLFLVGFALLFYPEPTFALSFSSILEGAGDVVVGVVNTILYLILSVITVFLTLATGLLIDVANIPISMDSEFVNTGWIVLRDVGNMFFVVILLLIAFGTILRIDQYSIKSLLPKVILMAILVNFSKIIVGFFIEISQIVMLTFAAAYQEAGAGNFFKAFQIDGILTLWANAGTDAGLDSGNVFQALLGANIYATVALVVVLAFLVIFLVRIVALWILAVFSPLAFVLSAVPSGQRYASMWWEQFAKYVILGPVLAFFLWLSLATLPRITGDAEISATGNNASSGSAGLDTIVAETKNIPGGPTAATQPIKFLHFMLSTAMLLISLYFAQQIGGAAGKIAGGAIGKLQTIGKGTLRAGTYFPREWGKRAGYNIGERALGAVGRNVGLLGIGDAALMAKTRLKQNRDANAKPYKDTLSAMDPEDLRVVWNRAQQGRLPGLLGIQGGIIRETEATKAIRDHAIKQYAARGTVRPNENYGYVRDTLREKHDLKQQQNDAKQRGDTQEVARLQNEIDRRDTVLQQSASQDFGHTLDMLKQIGGYKRDFDGNDTWEDSEVGKLYDNMIKNNLKLMPGLRQVMVDIGPTAGREVDIEDERKHIIERLPASAIANLDAGALKNPGLMNDILERDYGATEGAFKRIKRVNFTGSNADAEYRRALVQAAKTALNGHIMGQRRGTRFYNLYNAANDSYAQTPEFNRQVATMVANTGNRLSTDQVKDILEQAYQGGAGSSGASPSPQADIDMARYHATRELMAGRSDYENSEEYKANKGAYYEPENFIDIQERLNDRQRHPQTTVEDVENVTNGGARQIMREYEGAGTGPDGEKLKPAEATLLGDLKELNLGEAAGRSLSWETEGETLEKILPQILQQQQQLHGLDDSEVGKLEEALRNTQNINLIDRNRSTSEAMQTISHERMESLARLPDFKQFIDSIWQALSPEEQAKASSRIKDMWGEDLSDDDVRREYFAEASANEESRFGRKTGIRFTDKQRAVWQQGPQPVREQVADAAAVAPPAEFNPEDMVSAIMSALKQSGSPDVSEMPVEELREAIKELSEAVAGFNASKLQKGDVSKAIEDMVSKQGSGGQLSTRLLKEIAYRIKQSNGRLSALKNELASINTESDEE